MDEERSPSVGRRNSWSIIITTITIVSIGIVIVTIVVCVISIVIIIVIVHRIDICGFEPRIEDLTTLVYIVICVRRRPVNVWDGRQILSRGGIAIVIIGHGVTICVKSKIIDTAVVVMIIAMAASVTMAVTKPLVGVARTFSTDTVGMTRAKLAVSMICLPAIWSIVSTTAIARVSTTAIT